MTKRKRYGCYDPNGEMCITGASSGDLQEKASSISSKEIDNFYAKKYEKYRDGEDLKQDLQVDSSITFCVLCQLKNEPTSCKKYRAKGKRKVFW